MNKNEIKQIILEEIEDALKEMGMSPEMMAADSRPEEDDDITPPGIEDMSPDPMFGPDPSFVEEEHLNEDEGDVFLNQFKPGTHAYNVVGDGKFFTISQFGSGYDANPPVNVTDYLKNEMANTDKDSQYYEDLEMDLEAAREIAQVVNKMGGRVSDVSPGEGGTPDLEFVYTVNNKGDLIGQAILKADQLNEMARTSNVFKLSQNADLKQVLQFMQRVNDVLKTYKSPGQKRPKKRFTPAEMKALAKAMLNPAGFTSKDVIAATSYNSPAQANKFLKALEMKGLITLTSQLKKAQEPTRDPNAPETRGRKRRDAEFDMADDPTMMDFGDFEDLDLSDPLAEIDFTGMQQVNPITGKSIKQKFDPSDPLIKSLNKKGFTTFIGKIKVNYEVRPDLPNKIDIISLDGKKVQNTGEAFSFAKKHADTIIKNHINNKQGLYQYLSENTNKMSELEKYIKKVIRESKQVKLQEAKASRNLKDLIALGLLASDKDKLTKPGTLEEGTKFNPNFISYQQAQDILAQKGVDNFSISGADLADIGPGEALHTWWAHSFDNPNLGGYQVAKIVKEKDVEQLLSNLNSIEVSPDSAADIAQQVMDSGLETIAGSEVGVSGGAGVGSGGPLGDYSAQALDIFGDLTQGVGELLGVSPENAAIVLGTAAIAGPLVYLISKAAKGKDTVMPDFVDKFIAKFADKLTGAAEEAGIETKTTVQKAYKSLMTPAEKERAFQMAKASAKDDPYYQKGGPGYKFAKKRFGLSEAKSPLAKKMKEIENQGRVAALETKLAAIAEMIEETEGRLTRIDEDNEFRDMMDKNAVKEVRKQLKELERAQAKLEKEKAKMEGKGMKSYKDKEVMDEDASTNLELKSLEKKIYSALKGQGYKVELSTGRAKNIKSSDFNKYSEKDKWAVVFMSEEEGGKRPGINVLWKDPAKMATDQASANEVYSDFISKLRQSVPELKDTRIEKEGGNIGIEGSEAIGIYPEKGSNLSESTLRMQKLANIIKG